MGCSASLSASSSHDDAGGSFRFFPRSGPGPFRTHRAPHDADEYHAQRHPTTVIMDATPTAPFESPPQPRESRKVVSEMSTHETSTTPRTPSSSRPTSLSAGNSGTRPKDALTTLFASHYYSSGGDSVRCSCASITAEAKPTSGTAAASSSTPEMTSCAGEYDIPLIRGSDEAAVAAVNLEKLGSARASGTLALAAGARERRDSAGGASTTAPAVAPPRYPSPEKKRAPSPLMTAFYSVNYVSKEQPLAATARQQSCTKPPTPPTAAKPDPEKITKEEEHAPAPLVRESPRASPPKQLVVHENVPSASASATNVAVSHHSQQSSGAAREAGEAAHGASAAAPPRRSSSPLLPRTHRHHGHHSHSRRRRRHHHHHRTRSRTNSETHSRNNSRSHSNTHSRSHSDSHRTPKAAAHAPEPTAHQADAATAAAAHPELQATTQIVIVSAADFHRARSSISSTVGSVVLPALALSPNGNGSFKVEGSNTKKANARLRPGLTREERRRALDNRRAEMRMLPDVHGLLELETSTSGLLKPEYFDGFERLR